jgi:hypothetical protein
MPRVTLLISPREVAALWYRAADSATPVAQGDQFWGLDLFDAHVDGAGTVTVDRLRANLIVITQSCDLEHEKVRNVLAAPLYALSDWLQVNPDDLARLEDIRRGYDPSLYLLPTWPDATVAPARSDRVVDLGDPRIIPFAILRSALDAGIDRVSLSSPAREHFSQAVARSFMRVGLPADIPSFSLKRIGEDELPLNGMPFDEGLLQLKKALRVSRKRFYRASTGETYWTLTTKGHNPALVGAGCDEAQVMASLGIQISLAVRRLRDGDTRWAWLEEYVDPGWGRGEAAKR